MCYLHAFKGYSLRDRCSNEPQHPAPFYPNLYTILHVAEEGTQPYPPYVPMSNFCRCSRCDHVYMTVGFILSPLGDAYVCLGQQLRLICVTDHQFLEWSITMPNRNYVRTRLVSSSEERDIPPLTVNYTAFSFLRTSRVPLNITLMISNATADMKIFCTEYRYHDSHSSTNHTLATIVNVVMSESDVTRKSFTKSNDQKCALEGIKNYHRMGFHCELRMLAILKVCVYYNGMGSTFAIIGFVLLPKMQLLNHAFTPHPTVFYVLRSNRVSHTS